MEKLIEFRKVLMNINDFSWADSLFLPEDKRWSLSSPCSILNLDDLEDDEEVPPFAADNRLIYVLSIADIQDLVDNAMEQ